MRRRQILKVLRRYDEVQTDRPYDPATAYWRRIKTSTIWTAERLRHRVVRFDPKPPWWKTLFGTMTPWSICEMVMERLGILKPGQGEEP